MYHPILYNISHIIFIIMSCIKHHTLFIIPHITHTVHRTPYYIPHMPSKFATQVWADTIAGRGSVGREAHVPKGAQVGDGGVVAPPHQHHDGWDGGYGGLSDRSHMCSPKVCWKLPPHAGNRKRSRICGPPTMIPR